MNRALRPIFVWTISLWWLLLTPKALLAANNVEVEFVDPVHYTDLEPYAYNQDSGPLPAIERHLHQLASEGCLTEGDRLHIRILDIDLAGRLEWWRGRGFQYLRVMRGITWPRMHLTYRWLDSAGQLRGEEETRLSDMNYLTHSRYLTVRDEPYGYDKAMLSRWFRKQFCPNRYN